MVPTVRSMWVWLHFVCLFVYRLWKMRQISSLKWKCLSLPQQSILAPIATFEPGFCRNKFYSNFDLSHSNYHHHYHHHHHLHDDHQWPSTVVSPNVALLKELQLFALTLNPAIYSILQNSEPRYLSYNSPQENLHWPNQQFQKGEINQLRF